MVAPLAPQNRLNTNLLFKWRRAYQAGQYEPPTLLPVEVAPEERTIESAAALPVQLQIKTQPVARSVFDLIVAAVSLENYGVEMKKIDVLSVTYKWVSIT